MIMPAQDHRLLASKEKCMRGYEVLKKNLHGVKIKPVFPRMTLIATLEAYFLSLWYDFVVDSPLAVPRVLQLTLQYMTLSYVQIFQLIFIKSF